MKDLLKKICENKRSEIEKSKERCSFNSLEKILKDKTNRNFKELLIEKSPLKTWSLKRLLLTSEPLMAE